MSLYYNGAYCVRWKWISPEYYKEKYPLNVDWEHCNDIIRGYPLNIKRRFNAEWEIIYIYLTPTFLKNISWHNWKWILKYIWIFPHYRAYYHAFVNSLNTNSLSTVVFLSKCNKRAILVFHQRNGAVIHFRLLRCWTRCRVVADTILLKYSHLFPVGPIFYRSPWKIPGVSYSCFLGMQTTFSY